MREITAAFFLSVAAQSAAAQSIPLSDAEKAFVLAEQINLEDGGRLWGMSVCGPLIFADPKTHEVVANRADAEGKLTPKEGVWVGRLPDDLTPANSAVEWAGVHWTILTWPIPTEPRDRRRLLAHECFHRIQHDLKLPATDANNAHLDSKDGRIWIQLEWRALERALSERGKARVQALKDALSFRQRRRVLIRDAAAREDALEMNEGLAEYTGYRLASTNPADRRAGVIANLHGGPYKPTFVRSFAYVSGPAYGLLLDESGVRWRTQLRADTDMGVLLARAYRLPLPQGTEREATAAAESYEGDELIAAEEYRETKRQAQAAGIRKRFVEDPVLLLPPSSRFSYGFNPNNVVSLDENTAFYPWVRVTDEWGVLEANGGLVVRENGRVVKVVVPAANDANGSPVRGDDWKLDLAPGWKIVPATRGGDQTVEKRE
jgi:hypothetical protein